MRAWALESGVRWGEDVSRRERYQLGSLPQGTWATALDRLLLGVAMAEEDQRFVGTVLPVDDVGSSDVDLVGRLAEFVDRLTATLARARRGATRRRLVRARSTAPSACSPTSPRPTAGSRRRPPGPSTPCGPRRAPTLRLADVVALLEPHLAGRPTRANFRTGALTVCSLAPMRAVPHRVVALLGMDDGAFPRGSGRDGDDVLARDPLVGERDARQEDRQLFLDAVTSAAAAPGRRVLGGRRAHRCDATARGPRRRAARRPRRRRHLPRRAGPRATRWSTTRSRRSTSATSCRAGSAAANRSASTCSTSPRRSRRRRADRARRNRHRWHPPESDHARPRGPGVHPGAPGPRVRPDAARRDPARRRAAARRPAPPGAGRPRPLGRRRPAAAGRAGRHLPRRRRRGRAAPRSHAAGHARRRHAPADPCAGRAAARRVGAGTWSSPRPASTSRSRWTTDACSPARSTACAATCWSARCSPGSGPSTACAPGCSCSRCRRRSRTAPSRR